MQRDETAPGPGSPASAEARRARTMRLGLTVKILALSGVSIALVALILALSFSSETEKMLQDELSNRGRLAALSLANTSATLVFAQDFSGLDALAAATLGDVPDAAYVVVRDERGERLADAAQESLGESRAPATPIADLDLGTRFIQRTETIAEQEMLHVVALITFQAKLEQQYLDPLGLTPDGGAGTAGLKVLGTVEIGFPLAHLRSQIAAASRKSLGLAGLVLAACLLAMFPLARFTTKPLADLSRAALGIAAGDLRQDVKRAGNDEVADLAGSFARMVSELQSMLGELKEAAAALAQESDVMLGAATRQAAMAAQQSASLSEMNASIREIAQTSTTATDHADRVIASTQTAEESSRVGEGVVEEAIQSTAHVEQHVGAIAARLGDLTGRVSQIGDIIGTVKDLAARSNVLALNAAIQAARSGESSAGFSVIAREMRALAEQSSGAAGEVPKLLGEIAETTRVAASASQQGTEKARSTAALAQRAGSAIGNLAGVCRESAVAARHIAESSRQQATGVNDVVAALAQLSRAADGNVEGSEEMRRVAERLKAVSGRLTGLAERYRS